MEIRKGIFARTANILSTGDASASTLIDALLADACAVEASDIHLDPQSNGLAVCFRVDGELTAMCMLPHHLYEACIARLKVLAGLRTDEHAMPQDGRFSYEYDEAGSVDVRISIMPTYRGENAVLRLLRAKSHTLEGLGASSEVITAIEYALRGSGLLLVVGSTGSGKTTTLYTILQMLTKRGRSISSIEDPVEYSVQGVRQVEAGSRSGLTFATGLRALLRQDPDVLMIGEIRDAETAQLATQAALTGHLVISSLHAEDAAHAMPRLIGLGIEPSLLDSALRLVIAQKLVHRADGGRIGIFEFSSNDHSK